MKPAIEALRVYLAAQGIDLGNWPIRETFERIEAAEIPLVDMSQALTGARLVVEQGGKIALYFTREDETTVLESAGLDEWRLVGVADVFSADLAGVEPQGRWSTQELERSKPNSLDGATCDVGLDKNRWSRPVANATGRCVWLGVGAAPFIDWMARSTWEGSAQALFALPGALVLLDDWRDPPVTAGSRMTVGDLQARADPAPIDERWPEPSDLWAVRAIDVDVDALPDGDMKHGLSGMAAAASAWLIAEEGPRESLRPSRDNATTWTIPSDPRANDTGIPVIRLARWVTEDATATRLVVARHVAAERIPDPFADADATPVVSAAEIAYESAVSAHVQAALKTQLELERSFQDVDGKVSDVRDALRSAVDQTVVRALTASLGVAVAALSVSEVRGWPTVLAAGAVAAYVLFTAWWVLRTMRNDLTSRVEALHALIKERQLGLGTDVAQKISGWKSNLRARARWAQVMLTGFAIAIAIGGAVLGSTLDRSPDMSSPRPTSPAMPSSNASHTQAP